METGISRIYVIIVPGVMIGDENRHKSFDRMYNPNTMCTRSHGSVVVDLFELYQAPYPGE